MALYTLALTLASPSTFGVGYGGGSYDLLTATDPVTGLPRVPADTLLGLLAEGAASTLRSLAAWPDEPDEQRVSRYSAAAHTLFGGPSVSGALTTRAGHATVPPAVEALVREWIEYGEAGPRSVRQKATEGHRQTAVDPVSGVGRSATLRQTERVLAGTPLELPLSITCPLLVAGDEVPASRDQARTSSATPGDRTYTDAAHLLALSAAWVRRAGAHRRRGMGALGPLRLLAAATLPSHSAGDDVLDAARAEFFCLA